MKKFILLSFFFLIAFDVFSQTLIARDDMELPSTWRGVSTNGINSSYTGGLSSSSDNPPNYPMYASSDTCYVIKGIGLGSSPSEVDTFVYPSLPVIANRSYEIRFKVASFGLSPGTNTAAGLDGSTDTLEFQFKLANSAWFRDCKIIGSSNAMWSFDGAIGTNAKLPITRNANTAPNLYVSNASNPITSVAVRLFQGTYTSIQIRFISKLNGSGETWMLDDVEVWDMTVPLPIELLSFDGFCNQDHVKISWATASEINNDFFTILSSDDGFEFEPIGTVDGSGNSNFVSKYEFSDEKKFSGLRYYKLCQTDFDGKNECFGPIAVLCEPFRKRAVNKVINFLGQEINDDYVGLKLYIYQDGTVKKTDQ